MNFVGKSRTITEVLYRTEKAQYLLTPADAVFIHLHLAFKQAPQMLGAIALGIYYLVFFQMMYLEIVHNKSPLIVVEERPYRREVVVDNSFDCRLYHRMPKCFCVCF